MTEQHLHFVERVDAPVDRVFDAFADHQWFVGLFLGRCRRVATGQDHPNGVGSVRRIGAGPVAIDETIVAFQQHDHIHYQVTRGPLRNHLGTLVFREEAGGTLIDYHIRYEGKIPLLGELLKPGLQFLWWLNARRRIARLAAP